MPKSPHPPGFQKHLDKVRVARERTDAAISSFVGGNQPAGKILAAAWQILFDHLSDGKSEVLSLNDLNTAAGIVFKLVQSTHQLSTLEDKARTAAAQATTAPTGLTPELCEKLEGDLNMI